MCISCVPSLRLASSTLATAYSLGPAGRMTHFTQRAPLVWQTSAVHSGSWGRDTKFQSAEECLLIFINLPVGPTTERPTRTIVDDWRVSEACDVVAESFKVTRVISGDLIKRKAVTRGCILIWSVFHSNSHPHLLSSPANYSGLSTQTWIPLHLLHRWFILENASSHLGS